MSYCTDRVHTLWHIFMKSNGCERGGSNCKRNQCTIWNCQIKYFISSRNARDKYDKKCEAILLSINAGILVYCCSSSYCSGSAPGDSFSGNRRRMVRLVQAGTAYVESDANRPTHANLTQVSRLAGPPAAGAVPVW